MDNNYKLWFFFTVPVCIFLATIFIVSGFSFSNPVKPPEPLKVGWYRPETPRKEIVKNEVIVGQCWVCHAMWVGIPDPNIIRPIGAHPEVKLSHGKNKRCYNCHMITDRDKWTSNDGKGIIYTNVAKLCGRCHGIAYRNWLNGTHGVNRGKWDAKRPFDVTRPQCNYCHDPHSPEYRFKHFAPPPVWDKKFIRTKKSDIFHEGEM